MQTVKFFFVAIALLIATGCTTLQQNDSLTSQQSSDPFEGLNRNVYAFNSVADKAILKPVASAYHTVLPDAAERGVSRFFKNLGEPLNIINNLLQGKVDGALNSTYRFAVNSTIGLLGIFDVAKAYDVEPKPEDFGQTLASWGVKPGPYVMLPFLGPTNFRDGVGRAIDSSVYYPINTVTDSNNGQLSLFVLQTIDTRASLLGLDDTLDKQLDPYLFLKEAFESNRINAIYDGSPPKASEEDFDF